MGRFLATPTRGRLSLLNSLSSLERKVYKRATRTKKIKFDKKHFQLTTSFDEVLLALLLFTYCHALLLSSRALSAVLDFKVIESAHHLFEQMVVHHSDVQLSTLS